MAKGFDCCETTEIYSEVQSSYKQVNLSIIMMLIDRNPAVCVCVWLSGPKKVLWSRLACVVVDMVKKSLTVFFVWVQGLCLEHSAALKNYLLWY